MECVSRLTRVEFNSYQAKSCSVCPSCSTLQDTLTFCKWCNSKVINVTNAYLGGVIRIIDNTIEPQKCAECKQPLWGMVTGKSPSSKGLVCNDCYYKVFGEELDDFLVGEYR